MSQRCAQTQEIEATEAEKQPDYWPAVVLTAT